MILKIAGILTAFIVLVILGIYQSGFFVEKVSPELIEKTASFSQDAIAESVIIEKKIEPIFFRASATVHSRDNVDVSSRIMARILEIDVREGDTVKKGDLLIKLDDRDLNAQYNRALSGKQSAEANLEAAKAAVKGAESALKTVEKEYLRTKNLLKQKAVSQSTFDNIEGEYSGSKSLYEQSVKKMEQARAGVFESEQSVIGAYTVKEYTEITAPMDGVVYERLADSGDLAVSGKPVLKIFNPKRLMVEANISEKYIEKVFIGQKLNFYIEAVKREYSGEVREIVPFIDSTTRTFLIKVCLGEEETIKPGMFGTVFVPVDKEIQIIIDNRFVESTGQIENVFVQDLKSGNFQRRCIRTVKADDPLKLKVISGLHSGDVLGLKKEVQTK